MLFQSQQQEHNLKTAFIFFKDLSPSYNECRYQFRSSHSHYVGFIDSKGKCFSVPKQLPMMLYSGVEVELHAFCSSWKWEVNFSSLFLPSVPLG